MSLNLYPLQTVTRQRKSTSSLLQYANKNRNQGRFNNVIIRSNGTSIPANQMVLSCYCSFFEQIFALETKQVNDVIVEIPEIDQKLLELLIQYIYTGQICIDSNCVFHILAAAHHLLLDEVKEFCFEFLESCLTPNNCITILVTAKQYENFILTDQVYKYISDNYETIAKTPAFLNLDDEKFFFMVYDLKSKFYVNHDLLCRSLLSWTKQNEETRKKYFQSRLSKFVKADQLLYCLVKDLLNERLICEIPDYFALLIARIQFLKTKGTKILSIGRKYTERSVKVIYSLDDKTEVIYPDLPIPLGYSRALKVNNFVYCIGGNEFGSLNLRKVFRLNLNEATRNMKWNEMAEMNYRRLNHGAAVFKDTLVVCGGHDGKNYLSSSEAYDAEQNKWNLISCLKQSRSGNQSATSSGCLYTMGGEMSNTVERLNGLDQLWETVSSMQTPRNEFAAVSCNDVIYAIGGTSCGLDSLKSVEKYDCKADRWFNVNEMNIERRGHFACVMQGKIFVVGGRNDKYKPVREIECYDPLTKKWDIVGKFDYIFDDHSIVAL